jgi:hypothetical protein
MEYFTHEDMTREELVEEVAFLKLKLAAATAYADMCEQEMLVLANMCNDTAEEEEEEEIIVFIKVE